MVWSLKAYLKKSCLARLGRFVEHVRWNEVCEKKVFQWADLGFDPVKAKAIAWSSSQYPSDPHSSNSSTSSSSIVNSWLLAMTPLISSGEPFAIEASSSILSYQDGRVLICICVSGASEWACEVGKKELIVFGDTNRQIVTKRICLGFLIICKRFSFCGYKYQNIRYHGFIFWGWFACVKII